MQAHSSVVVFAQVGDGLYMLLEDLGRLVHKLQTAYGGLPEIGVLEQLFDRGGDQGERGLDLVKEVSVELELVFIALLLLCTQFVVHLLLMLECVVP